MEEEPASEDQDEEALVVLENEAQLVAFVNGLRGQEPSQLEVLTQCNNKFRNSDFVDALKRIEGDWVVSALGGLALAETNSILRAALIHGLCASGRMERFDDANAFPILRILVASSSSAENDPYDVGRDVALFAQSASKRQSVDYVALMSDSLANSDNPMFLALGYDGMASFPEGRAVLFEAIREHPHENGRLGAIEGVRGAARKGLVSSEEAAQVLSDALAVETVPRNQGLILEALLATGGEAGTSVLVEVAYDSSEAMGGVAAEYLAQHMAPDEALIFVGDLLGKQDVAPERKEQLYRAMAVIPAPEAEQRLLDVVSNPEMDRSERLAALRALRTRESTDNVRQELARILTGDDPGEIRAQALQLAHEAEHLPVDELRCMGTSDADPAFRAQAIEFAGLEPGPTSSDWLFSRVYEDESLQVKAAAMKVLATRARYGCEQGKVLSFLREELKASKNPETCSLIASEIRSIESSDPGDLRANLDRNYEFYNMLVSRLSGPAKAEARIKASYFRSLKTCVATDASAKKND